MDYEQYDEVFKIVVVGDTGVGKTNLIKLYSMQKRLGASMPTIGVEYTSKTLPLPRNRKAKVQIWDTAGQSQYRSITMNHFRKSVGALVIYDVTNRNSFIHAAEWVNAVRERAEETVHIRLIGNKIDLTNTRVVSREQGETMAKNLGVYYSESTVNELQSITNIFQKLVQEIDMMKQQNKVSSKSSPEETFVGLAARKGDTKESNAYCKCLG